MTSHRSITYRALTGHLLPSGATKALLSQGN